MDAAKPNGFLNIFHARPRLFVCMAIGVGAWLAMPWFAEATGLTRAVASWNIFAIAYMAMASHMMFWSHHSRMKERAAKHDDGAPFVLTLVVASALACIGAIVGELAVSKDLQGAAKFLHIGLAALTVASSWGFTQVMFAIHYAHDYYAGEGDGHRGGLEFPGGHAPDYGDFVYFACVIGTSGQTADISFSSRRMRRTGLVHCVLSFFFNTTLVGLTVNIASGLF